MKIMKAGAAAAMLLMATQFYGQTTIHVPADVPTIQAAINAASNGDTIVVSPGTYTENLNFSGKAVTVTSASGPYDTIIDGGAKGTVVTFNAGEGPASVLNGFAIQNGYNTSWGGGIQITNASPTITGNLITNNHGIEGIGIEVYGGSPLIKNNTITANTQAGGDGGCGGGGILSWGSSTTPASPTIAGNVITNNSVGGGGDGGGIAVCYFGRPIIQNNLIQGNYAYNYGGGIEIGNYDGAIVSQNVIVNNSVGGGGSGGGVAIYAASTVNVIDNTISGNSAWDYSSGLFVASGTPQSNTIANNIVVAAAGQSAVVCDPLWSSNSPVFDHNDFYSPSGAAMSGVCDLNSTPGNFSADPQFVNAANDFHLQPTSPAIDAGDNRVLNMPQQDREGNPRIVDGKNLCVATVDLGAYELQAAPLASWGVASLSFGPQLLNTSSSPQSVSLNNTGATCLQVAGLPISGDFSAAASCGATLPAGQSCNLSVSFSPTAVGTRTGTLSLNSNSPITPTLALSGTGVVPSATLSSASLSFAGQVVGTISAAQYLTLSNTGGAPLHITSIVASGDFSQSNNCGSSLAAGGSCAIGILFMPSAAGARPGAVVITDDAYGGTQSARLSGTGLDYALAASPASVTISAGQSAYYTVNVSGQGGSFPSAVSLTCSGLPSNSTCSFSPSSLGPGITSASATMQISTTSRKGKKPGTPSGTSTITISGSSGALLHTSSVMLVVK